MKNLVLGLLAETSIHPGAGSDTGFVDLPVAREAATDYPVIAGSSFKGALLDMSRNVAKDDEKTRNEVFGKQDFAGQLLVSDVRLLLLPVRSLTSQYMWVTCPHLLERYYRDAARAGVDIGDLPNLTVDRMKYIGPPVDDLFLEERQFSHQGETVPAQVHDAVEKLIPHQSTKKRLKGQLVILNDADMAWFCRFGLAVNARNQLSSETKTSENLWYEETIPPDTLFYNLLSLRSAGKALDHAAKMFEKRPYVQAGGNETVGQGWLAVTVVQEGGAM